MAFLLWINSKQLDDGIWLSKRKSASMWLWLAVHRKPHQSCYEILLIGDQYFAENKMNVRHKMKQRLNKITINLSIDWWWWCGFFFTRLRLIALGHVAHIVCAPHHSNWSNIKRTRHTHQMTHALDNSIGILFFSFVSFSFSISDHPVVITMEKIKFR